MDGLEWPEVLCSGQRWSAWRTPGSSTVIARQAHGSKKKSFGVGKRQGSDEEG